MIENKAAFNYTDLATIFGEESFVNIPKIIEINSVVTDSRKIKNGNLFVALVGEKIDAHSKLNEAFELGAKICIVNENWYKEQKTIENEFVLSKFHSFSFIIVKNTLKSLGTLARFHRDRFNLPIIVVAGSNGKTTTKEMIVSVMSIKYNVLSTYKNFNNQIGVPLMLLSLDDTYDCAVIEIATNSFGEIFYLATLVNPKYGVITNIGKEHLEILEDLDGVEMEETSLFAYLKKHLGFAFINADDKRLIKYTNMLDNKLVYGQNELSEVIAKFNFDESLLPEVEIDIKGEKFFYKLKEIGLGNAYASVVAFSIGYKLEFDINEICKKLSEFTTDYNSNYGRMRVEKYNLDNSKDLFNLTIINDCYNANPSSMQLALDSVNLIKENYQNVILVLGEMRELGDKAIEEHQELIFNSNNISNNIIFHGNEFEVFFDGEKDKKFDITKMSLEFQDKQISNTPLYFNDKNQIVNYLLNNIDNDKTNLILFKGSRGNELENILINLKSNLKLN